MDPITTVDTDTQRRLLALLERGQADQDTYAGRLSPDERVARGELHNWSPKDEVAHNNFWRQDAINRLKAALDGSSPPDTSDDLAWNDRIFLEQRETPWEQLVGETERLRAETGALIQLFTRDDLSQKNRYPWQRGDSLETLVLVNWYDHPAEHWANVYLRCREVERALELRRAVAATIRELFPQEPKLYSYMVFKLGGYAARGGRSEQAIGAIREALTVNPSLGEQVRKDSDFDSVRALPEFQALVGAHDGQS